MNIGQLDQQELATLAQMGILHEALVELRVKLREIRSAKSYATAVQTVKSEANT